MSARTKIFLTIAFILLAAAVLAFSTIPLRQSTQTPTPQPLAHKSFTDELIGNRQLTIEQEKNISLLLVGDIMLSRNVAAKVSKAKDPTLPYQKLAELLLSTDLNVGNLESPFSGRDDSNGTGSLVFNAPRSAVEGLEQYNFKILSLANNHALDQGSGAISFTRDHLARGGIQSYGAGKNLDEAWQPAIVELKGTKIGFVGASYASANDGGKGNNHYVARIEQLDRLKEAIEKLRSQTDIVIVTMHAGTEYTHTPNRGQIDFTHTAIDAGADMVVGHHPHWVQTIEKYNDKYIFYSLGNFIFDQEWSQKTKEGLTIKLTISNKKLKTAELLPVILENYCCPRPAAPAETTRILDGIQATSTKLRL